MPTGSTSFLSVANLRKIVESAKQIRRKYKNGVYLPHLKYFLFFAEFVVLLSHDSFRVVNQIVTCDNNIMVDNNKQPLWRFLLHFCVILGRYSCKNEKLCVKNVVFL